MADQPYSPADIWKTAYGELELQLPRDTFNTWLRDARLIAHEDGTFIIGVRNIYAREWLDQRLKKVVARTLSRLARRTVEVRFVLAPEHKKKKDDAPDVRGAGPLMEQIAPAPEEPPRFERLPPGVTGLNPRHTFDNLAVGDCNRLAVAAAKAVVEAPSHQFNPLFIHGGVGIGKSHLLHAIGNACAEKGRKVMVATAERFTNDLVGAIRKRETGAFRAKYRDVDVLLVDDVQFMAGKDTTQEEFHHTFNTLVNDGAQIVVAAHLPPGAIRGLDARLRSRFEGGLIVDLAEPDFLTRVDILEIKADLRAFDGRLPLDVLERIAEDARGSVRELEGALNRVIARALLVEGTPTMDLAEEALSEAASPPVAGKTTLDDVVMAVAEYYGVDPADLFGRARPREVSAARQVAMYIAHHEVDIPLQEIGERMDGRSHSTVLYSCDRVADLMKTESQVRRDVQAILRALAPERSPAERPRQPEEHDPAG